MSERRTGDVKKSTGLMMKKKPKKTHKRLKVCSVITDVQFELPLILKSQKKSHVSLFTSFMLLAREVGEVAAI